MKQRLWVVTELYYPELTSTGYYLTKIAEGLAKDFDVKVLCGQPSYGARGIKAPKHEVRNDVEIFRLIGTTLNKDVILFRIVNMVTLGISIFLNGLLRFRKGDFVLVVTTPPILPFLVAVSSLIRRAPYFLLIHDNYPEVLVAVGKLKEDSFFVKLLNFFNRWLYKNASKIIVVGRDMLELIKVKAEGFDVSLECIPNWAELEQVEPCPRDENQLLQELGIKDKFVFLYAGNMGYPNDLESIVYCVKELNNDERFHFIFLGSGVKRKWLEEETRGLRNVTLLPSRPRNEQKIFLNACDVGIVSLVKGMRGVSVPSRTYNLLAAGKPILALVEEDSEVAMILKEEEAGWVVEPRNPQKLLERIFEIYENKNLLHEMGVRAREAALEKYSPEKAIKSYIEVFNGVKRK
ncbi:MAG: glycosyltransferase WbuB [Acidobacteria bacterium]|jgi:glycosyltransferase involved in cell wall biosynthesis|nr:MAG: glycosyltransferase WbuB [Acidobacteriota bacterium]GIU81126.1 MAG: glycosyltransferase WbuB [Pyrinomonadaceae bacterium]